MERQQLLDGKLDKALASEGAAILSMPAVLAAVGLVGWALTSLGLNGPAMIFVGVPILVGVGLLVASADRR